MDYQHQEYVLASVCLISIRDYATVKQSIVSQWHYKANKGTHDIEGCMYHKSFFYSYKFFIFIHINEFTITDINQLVNLS